MGYRQINAKNDHCCGLVCQRTALS